MSDPQNSGANIDDDGDGATTDASAEPSQQAHHDPETEEDTASGGPAD